MQIMTFITAILLTVTAPTDTISKADEFKSTLIIANKLHTGMVINNYLFFENFPKRKATILNELYVGVQTRGNKKWHSQYTFPQIGVSFISGSLGNKYELGNAFAIIPNMTVHLLRKEKYNLTYSIGVGFSYFNTPFDAISNPYNILICSSITNMSFMQLAYNYRLNSQLEISAGVSYIHASNGHVQIPNAGMNISAANLGVKYYFNRNNQNFNTQNIYTSQKNRIFKFNFGLSTGLHEFAKTLEPVGTKKFSIHSAYFAYSYRYKNIHRFSVGINLKYYKSFNNYILENEFFTEHINLKSTVGTFYLSHEFLFGHFGFYFHGGLNFYTPFLPKYFKLTNKNVPFMVFLEHYTSSKLAIKYYLFETNAYRKTNFFIGMAVKANFGTADFAELSTGIVF